MPDIVVAVHPWGKVDLIPLDGSLGIQLGGKRRIVGGYQPGGIHTVCFAHGRGNFLELGGAFRGPPLYGKRPIRYMCIHRSLQFALKNGRRTVVLNTCFTACTEFFLYCGDIGASLLHVFIVCGFHNLRA